MDGVRYGVNQCTKQSIETRNLYLNGLLEPLLTDLGYYNSFHVATIRKYLSNITTVWTNILVFSFNEKT